MTSQDYPDPPTRPDNAAMDTNTTTEDPLTPFERDAHSIPQLDAFQYRHGIVVYTGIPRVSEYTNVFMMSSSTHLRHCITKQLLTHSLLFCLNGWVRLSTSFDVSVEFSEEFGLKLGGLWVGA